MSDLLVRDTPLSLGVDGDERLARAELRRQIGRLEHQLSRLVAEGFPRVEIDTGVRAVAPAPRALGLGELERVRDELADRVADARGALERAGRPRRPATASCSSRCWRGRPSSSGCGSPAHDVGEPGCGHWHSRPRLGLLGMLMGWWRVKISSGCPL